MPYSLTSDNRLVSSEYTFALGYMMPATLTIDYYSDILCVWAWIAQRRIQELELEMGQKIELQHHYVDIFGDVPTKMATQWKDKGGYQGFSEHVKASVNGFDEAEVSSRIWSEVKPTTSANAHLVVKAVELAHGKSIAKNIALRIRSSFFLDALDISNMAVLYDLVAKEGLSKTKVALHIQDGSAIAALMHDYQFSKKQGVKGSPSYVMDGGRQTLYGNVGYRVILANIEELLNSPKDEASWC